MPMKNFSFFLKMISFLLLIFIWIFTIINFNHLPEVIPTHFGSNGKADAFGNKNATWALAAIATGVFILLFYLSHNSSSRFLNLPRNIKSNPEISNLIVDLMNMTIMAMFAVINYGSILTALEKSEGLNTVLMYGLLFILFLIIIGSFSYSWKISKTKKS